MYMFCQFIRNFCIQFSVMRRSVKSVYLRTPKWTKLGSEFHFLIVISNYMDM
jgi:hypothetical protein